MPMSHAVSDQQQILQRSVNGECEQRLWWQHRQMPTSLHPEHKFTVPSHAGVQTSNTKLVQLPAVKYISLKHDVFQTESLKLFALRYITLQRLTTAQATSRTTMTRWPTEYDSQNMVTIMVLALKNWHTWNNVPTFGSPVVDEERMATEFPSMLRHCWLGNRKDIWPVTNLCYLSPMVLFLNKWRKKNREKTPRGTG